MTKTQQQQIEDAIVIAVEDDGMSKEEVLKYITKMYTVSPAFVLNAYREMYEEE